ncbi:MAG: tetratricopeptide repeat protein, partial [Nitrospirae bacterium]
MSFKKTVIVFLILIIAASAGCHKKSKEELFQEGKNLLASGNPSGAVVLLKTALKKDKNFWKARYQLALAYEKLGKLELAEKELKKVLLQNPSDIK